MIAKEFQEAFSDAWKKIHLPNSNHDLVILRKIIPWQRIIQRLSQFYSPDQGKIGLSLRVMVALLILQRLRMLSDRALIKLVQENRYAQFFCNVPDQALMTFINPTSPLTKFRQRLGIKGIAIIEEEIFSLLKWAGILKGETCLIDSTVLNASITYPNDVQLLFKALKKIKHAAHRHKVPLWWDQQNAKSRWRVFSLDKKPVFQDYLREFLAYFLQAWAGFETRGANWPEYARLSPLFLYSENKQSSKYKAINTSQNAWSHWMTWMHDRLRKEKNVPNANLARVCS